MHNQASKTVKGYELYEKLGAGGFGEVYRAYQPVLQREVAIKVILPDFANEPEFIRRFEAEAQLVARLEHPHIVPLYDYWREPDSAYLVMRWIRGGSLREALQSGGSWDVPTALLLIDQICGALYGAHRRGVVHRDIKPENILIDEDGNAYLTDFGIARVIGRDYSEADDDEQISGSLHYMAPEQLRGLPILNPQTDLYALGLVVYEILTGQYVFPEASISEVIYNNGNEPIPDIRRLKPAYPAALNDALQKATDKNLEQRFENALTFAQAIRQALTSGSATAPVSPPVDDTHLTNPYKGLRPFDEADSEDFFGREALTWQLLERMREASPLVRFLAVVGPSGSGKSSVVKAGLLPALRKDELKGASGWIIRAMVPGSQPLRALAEALLSAASKSATDFYTLLKLEPDGLLQAVNLILGSAETEFLLVIDQFEEIFTFATDEAERTHFLNLLYTALIAPATRLRVIVTMRADYYDRPLLYDDFGTLVKNRTEFVLPLMASELERAITGPASRIGLHVGSDLVAAIVDDVRREPGGLPLLQYALTELYEQREGRNLTLEAYYNSGGVTGALARRAEQVYTRLRPQPQAIARQIFLRLVNPDEMHKDTRQRTRRSELLTLGNTDMINDVLDTFDKFRLLTFDREPGTREPMVEVAHEALIRNWDRLQAWLDDSREDIRLQRRLAAYCAEWINTKRNPDFLLQGGRLLEFETWAKNTELTLTPDERTYIDQSIKERENLRTLERERKEREVRLVNYSQWVGRALWIAVVIAVIGAVILVTQTQIAARNAALSQSLALADGARYELETGNVDLALALALRANSVDQPPLQAQNALFTAAYAPGTRLDLPDNHDVRVATFSPNGGFILTGGCANQSANGCALGEMTLRDAVSGEVVKRFPVGDGLIRSIAINPASTQALIAAGNEVILWDTITWSIVNTFAGHTAEVRAVAFNTAGTQALSGASDNQVILWDIATGDQVRVLEGHNQTVRTVAFNPDGHQAVSGAVDGSLIVWNLTNGEPLHTLKEHKAAVTAISFNPVRTLAVTASDDQSLLLWDTTTWEVIRRLTGHAGGVTGVVFGDSEGQTILSSSLDNRVLQWDTATGQVLRQLRGHTSTIWSLSISPDYRTILTTSADDSIRLWNVVDGAKLQVFNGHTDVVNSVGLSSDGLFAFSASDDGHIIQWDVTTGELLHDFKPDNDRVQALSMAVNEAGTILIAGYSDGQVIVWDTVTQTALYRLAAHSQGVFSVALSPDGQLALSGADDGSLVALDLQTGQELSRAQIEPLAAINSIDLSADGQTVLVGLSDKRVLSWQIASSTLQPIATFNDSVRNVSFSQGNNGFLAQMQDGSLVVWDLTAGRELSGYFNRYTTERSIRGWGVALSPDGLTALSSASNNQLARWRLATGELIYSYQGHTDGIMSVAFNTAGDRAVSGSLDNSVIVWQIDRSTDELREWIMANRYVRDLSTIELRSYGLPTR